MFSVLNEKFSNVKSLKVNPDVSNVANMQWMFSGCENFNQDISNWDVSKVEDKDNMFNKCPIEAKYKPRFK